MERTRGQDRGAPEGQDLSGWGGGGGGEEERAGSGIHKVAGHVLHVTLRLHVPVTFNLVTLNESLYSKDTRL